jgi:tRNA A-37 threonylcarbamoyl transferase component Bud32
MLVGKDIGPYYVEQELGTGAMGTVYRAVMRDNGRRVAIKEIAYGLLANDTAVERFEREGEILKQLKHPNIVRFIGTGAYKPSGYKRKTPFFIMEYVEGESLDRILARRDRFSWQEVVALGRQLCAALQHAHQKGIIHRDLKPSNLMILADGTIKLTDFGIAKGADLTTLTATNCTVGTAAYMSPEQCRGEKNLTAKSDLYSMGVVFYELLTGRKPFQADSPIEMFRAHVESPFDRPSTVALDIPIWLDTLVCQLLEKKPEHRPYDAAMVSRVLEEVEQKVADLRSAGVDVATARRTDRGIARPADETDRDAARTLRNAVARKKVRKKTVPLAEKKWAQALMLGSALVGLAGLAFYLTRPPSAEKLFGQVRDAAEDRNFSRTSELAHRYLSLYGGLDDDRAAQVRDWDRELRTQRREEQLQNRIYGRLKQKPSGEAEQMAFRAVESEDAGDLPAAAEEWKKLQAAVEGESDPNVAVYAWVAQKREADLASQPRLERQLGDELNYDHALVPHGPKPVPGPAEEACFTALRFERFGDLAAARDRWESARDKYLKILDDRRWGVLAAVHAAALKETATAQEKEKGFRFDLLKRKLADADAVPSTADPADRHRALATCRDIVALYEHDHDPQVNAVARKAKQLLADRKWSGRER